MKLGKYDITTLVIQCAERDATDGLVVGREVHHEENEQKGPG